MSANLDKAVLTGRVHVDAISDESLEEINTAFPELIVVVAGMPKFFIRYLDWDNTLLYRYIANEGSAAIEPVAANLITEPKKESTDQYTFTWTGWDKVFYGDLAAYPGDITKIKKKINGQDSDYYEFIGWSPALDVPISGPMYFYAQFAFEDSWETIANHAAAGEINIYGLGGRKKFTYTIDGVQSTVEAEIVDINHDILTYTDADYNSSKSTAAFTFVFRVLAGLSTALPRETAIRPH